MNTPSTLPDWWYVANGQRLGPVSDQELQRLLIEGTLGPNSLVWKQGMERTWHHASQVQAFAEFGLVLALIDQRGSNAAL